MNENMMITDPPQVCDTHGCMNDALVMLRSSADKGWIRICPDCLDELFALQSGVTLPEQRAHVIDFHIPPKSSREIEMHVTPMGRAEPLPVDERQEQQL